MRLNDHRQVKAGIIGTLLPIALIGLVAIASALVITFEFSNAVNWIIEGLKR